MDKPKKHTHTQTEWIHGPNTKLPPCFAGLDLIPDMSVFKYKGEPLREFNVQALFEDIKDKGDQ